MTGLPSPVASRERVVRRRPLGRRRSALASRYACIILFCSTRRTLHAHVQQLKPSIYVEDLQKSADEGVLNLDFETTYMFHTAFIHGHAHWPAISDLEAIGRQFYGSVQPAVFDGPRVWTPEVREWVEKCLVRLGPIMKAYGETAPGLESIKSS
jgi:hypothetical protein